MSRILQGSSKVYTFTFGSEGSIVVVVITDVEVVVVVVSWPVHM